MRKRFDNNKKSDNNNSEDPENKFYAPNDKKGKKPVKSGTVSSAASTESSTATANSEHNKIILSGTTFEDIVLWEIFKFFTLPEYNTALRISKAFRRVGLELSEEIKQSIAAHSSEFIEKMNAIYERPIALHFGNNNATSSSHAATQINYYRALVKKWAEASPEFISDKKTTKAIVDANDRIKIKINRLDKIFNFGRYFCMGSIVVTNSLFLCHLYESSGRSNPVISLTTKLLNMFFFLLFFVLEHYASENPSRLQAISRDALGEAGLHIDPQTRVLRMIQTQAAPILQHTLSFIADNRAFISYPLFIFFSVLKTFPSFFLPNISDESRARVQFGASVLAGVAIFSPLAPLVFNDLNRARLSRFISLEAFKYVALLGLLTLRILPELFFPGITEEGIQNMKNFTRLAMLLILAAFYVHRHYARTRPAAPALVAAAPAPATTTPSATTASVAVSVSLAANSHTLLSSASHASSGASPENKEKNSATENTQK